MSQQDNSRASSHASTSLFQDGSDPQRRRSGFILFIYRNRRVLGTLQDSYEVSAQALVTKMGTNPFASPQS